VTFCGLSKKHKRRLTGAENSGVVMMPAFDRNDDPKEETILNPCEVSYL
jgi:hypothetical protein